MEFTLKQLSTIDHSRDAIGMEYIYPVISRRAGGVSVGINLNTNNACNWRCIYCQVPNLKRGAAPTTDLVQIKTELTHFLQDLTQGDFMERYVAEDMRKIADVALSGNGEPTSSAEFASVIDIVAEVLSHFGLSVPVRVITNGSLIGQKGRGYIQQGLQRLQEIGGEVWFKLDAGSASGFQRINNVTLQPTAVLKNLNRCAQLCTTWVQTCFFALDGKGPVLDEVDEIDSYLSLLKQAKNIQGVYLYGLARLSMQPEKNRLTSLDIHALHTMADKIRKIGLTVQVNP